MSIEYSMHIRRKKDGKEVAEFTANQLKSILGVDDDLVPTDKTPFGMDLLHSVAQKCEAKIDEIAADIARLREGVFRCKSVEVKRDIEDDIRWKQELIEEWKIARIAAWKLIGMVECLCEDLVMGRDAPDEDGYERVRLAYQHWATTSETEKGIDGLPLKEWFWVDGAELWVECR